MLLPNYYVWVCMRSIKTAEEIIGGNNQKKIYVPVDDGLRRKLTDSHSFSGSDIKVYMRIPNFFYRASSEQFVSESHIKNTQEDIVALKDSASFLMTPDAEAFFSEEASLFNELSALIGEREAIVLVSPGISMQSMPPFYGSQGVPSFLPIDQAAYDAKELEIAAKNKQIDDLRSTSVGQKVSSANGDSDKLSAMTKQQALAMEYSNRDKQRVNSELSSFRKLDELQTISISSHVGYSPVRALGTTAAIDYTSGPRSWAGTLIFTVFAKNVFDNYYFARDPSVNIKQYATSSAIERIPRFHMLIFAANEYGAMSQAGLKNVQLLNFSTTFSVDDMYTETTFNFVAEDYQDLTDRHVRQFFDPTDGSDDPHNADSKSGYVRIEDPYASLEGATPRTLEEIYGDGVNAGKRFAKKTFNSALSFFSGDS